MLEGQGNILDDIRWVWFLWKISYEIREFDYRQYDRSVWCLKKKNKEYEEYLFPSRLYNNDDRILH